MKLKNILFDLDGTLLPMNQSDFVEKYFESITASLSEAGHNPDTLKSAIIKSVYAMKHGDGTKLNESIFWGEYTKIYGMKSTSDIIYFNKYYDNDYNSLKSVTRQSRAAISVVDYAKKYGYRCILATNPLFPPIAIHKRLEWAGIDYMVFDYITTYDNSTYCKPNPMYYKEIADKNNLKCEECLMVGNDVDDDMCAREVGMNVFLLTDCLINKYNKDITIYPNGSFDDLKNYIFK